MVSLINICWILILDSVFFRPSEFQQVNKWCVRLSVNRAVCLNMSYCFCHSLSEQMTPAENLAAAFWQLTVLWCWHWLRDISLPVHFTPLIIISVTLLLSQYHVSLDGVRQTDKHANRKQTQCSDQERIFHKRSCRKFRETDVHDSVLAAGWGHRVKLYEHWRTITLCRYSVIQSSYYILEGFSIQHNYKSNYKLIFQLT